VLSLHRDDGSLAKNPSQVRGMFSSYFKKSFVAYALTNGVVVARDPCCKVVPHKVLSHD
jgi:hypothetical protein